MSLPVEYEVHSDVHNEAVKHRGSVPELGFADPLVRAMCAM